MDRRTGIRGSRTTRRRWVLVNYLSISLFLVLWYALPDSQRSRPIWLAVLLALLGTAGLSFTTAHLRTGLWRLVHIKSETLDERENHVTLDALRFSYATFAVACLTIILAQSIAGQHGIVLFDVVLPAILIYVAHTLPSSVIAWKEREV
ncbi:MAG: hypothetical protein JXQ29_11025 [Planctomycetes bacterium]|nr:hypothetical protein [Planctomycetota bacterium]